ncbi:MAG: VOC family protein [Gammaproteobacteria bacterium]|nr:VOC family protein [Gammaproteobacteria bacterium]MDH5803184.1 VOC family protein [Gammaproteobacteria bacterium]
MTTQTNPVNWFEIPSTDIDRAKRFYEAVLGVDLALNEMGPMKMAWFPMAPGAFGSTGTLVQAEGYTPSHDGSLVYFHVDDIDGTLDKVSSNGGKVLRPKMSIGEYGFVSHFQDSEGNRVALHADH